MGLAGGHAAPPQRAVPHCGGGSSRGLWQGPGGCRRCRAAAPAGAGRRRGVRQRGRRACHGIAWGRSSTRRDVTRVGLWVAPRPTNRNWACCRCAQAPNCIAFPERRGLLWRVARRRGETRAGVGWAPRDAASTQLNTSSRGSHGPLGRHSAQAGCRRLPARALGQARPGGTGRVLCVPFLCLCCGRAATATAGVFSALVCLPA